LVLLPFVFAACQNPTAADYVPPPPSYEPEPQPPQPPPPAYMVQDLEALYQNLWGAITYHGGGTVWHSPPGYSNPSGWIRAYAIDYRNYLMMSAYLQGFRATRTVTPFATYVFVPPVAQLFLTAQSLTVIKYYNAFDTRHRTQYIVPRYVRL
jgi:hypothetical protein